ncbi:septum formation initiator family protein [Pseudovibrio sp. Tun.PSC04-5.I4]|uniref:FtsB family cell division protein n=1 Tax=Pseudovibrio sp. Tun.PSC04-5.I4 TaxID=1798213 RepID=UPI000880134D|nr:septum formation initiator family protein [Pseudovibrio sp. Tun.PSC04-5.I4]SDR05834.1 Cell division protein FtsB [Pseudovibrio sp. Tun.PSC04-5.I4]
MLATTRQRKDSYLKNLVVPGFAIGALCYFAFHALNGELGLVGRPQIEHEILALELQLGELRSERMLLQRRVMLLDPESLDPDMVDERARASLNLAHVNEVAIMRN